MQYNPYLNGREGVPPHWNGHVMKSWDAVDEFDTEICRNAAAMGVSYEQLADRVITWMAMSDVTPPLSPAKLLERMVDAAEDRLKEARDRKSGQAPVSARNARRSMLSPKEKFSTQFRNSLKQNIK